MPAIADEAVAHFHELLAEGWPAVDETLLGGTAAGGIAFLGRPVVRALRPLFVGARQYADGCRAATQIGRAVNRLARRLAADPDLRRTLRLDPPQERLVAAEPDPEPIVAGSIDVGRIVFQSLAAATDPFPRLPGSVFDGPLSTPPGDKPDSPFAVLANLKAKR